MKEIAILVIILGSLILSVRGLSVMNKESVQTRHQFYLDLCNGANNHD